MKWVVIAQEVIVIDEKQDLYSFARRHGDCWPTGPQFVGVRKVGVGRKSERGDFIAASPVGASSPGD